MIPGKYSGLVTCVAAAGMGMFVALWLLDFALIRDGWFHNSSAVPAKEWISALSGWAAAIGAVLAAIVTITKLRDQIEEQKKQTEFLVGDAMPTIDCLQDIDDPQQIVLRIVNWNRRTVLIYGIGFDNLDRTNLKTQIMELKENNIINKNIIRQPIIHGWENRNAAPNNLKIKIAAERNGVILDDFPLDMQLRVMIRLVGQSHEMIILKCDLHPQNFEYNH